MNSSESIEQLVEKAEKIWDTTRLSQDLGAAKKKYLNARQERSLSPKEYNCLCGILCYWMPKSLAKILFVTDRGLRAELSRGLYRYIETLIQNQTERSIQLKYISIPRELENLGYKKGLLNPPIGKQKKVKANISLDMPEIGQQQLDKIMEILRQVPGNLSLEIKEINKGSIEIVFETTEEGAEWLEQLHAIGELEELLGVPVLGVGREEAIANLGEWLQEARDTFAAGWQTVKSFLNNLEGDPAAYRFSSAVRAGEIEINDFEVIASGIKLLDLEEPLGSRPIPLVVNLGRESNGERDILLQVYPCKGERYVPRGLQMLVLAGGEIFLEATAAEADDYIQLRCSGQPGEKFSIKLVLGDASVSENFLF